jgi:anti-sigma regulatory factor (Ser/Thr protein kinase)
MKVTFDGSPRAAGQVRAFVRSSWKRLGPPHGVTMSDVLIVADELVTNAVQVGSRAVHVDLASTSAKLELVVTDDADGWPTPRRASDTDPNGRGLAIVEQLCDEWSVAATDAGKSVTATWFARTSATEAGPCSATNCGR